MECHMVMGACFIVMETSIGESGLMGRSRDGACRFFRREGCSMRGSGKMVSSTVMVNCCSRVVHTILVNLKEVRKTVVVSTTI